jgi:hypothetical protein
MIFLVQNRWSFKDRGRSSFNPNLGYRAGSMSYEQHTPKFYTISSVADPGWVKIRVQDPG